jgi:hypothetical protein
VEGLSAINGYREFESACFDDCGEYKAGYIGLASERWENDPRKISAIVYV